MLDPESDRGLLQHIVAGVFSYDDAVAFQVCGVQVVRERVTRNCWAVFVDDEQVDTIHVQGKSVRQLELYLNALAKSEREGDGDGEASQILRGFQ
ncbi:MAG: hypothetical protein ABEI98_07800, partial [Halorhabdus sp.]